MPIELPIELPIVLPIELPIVLPIELPIALPIELPIELPKLRQQPGPGPAGSWAGPAWFKMLLGLGGNQGGGGGGKGFCFQKSYFFQKKFCREGDNLRGSVIKKCTFSKKSFAAKVPI